MRAGIVSYLEQRHTSFHFISYYRLYFDCSILHGEQTIYGNALLKNCCRSVLFLQLNKFYIPCLPITRNKLQQYMANNNNPNNNNMDLIYQ